MECRITSSTDSITRSRKRGFTLVEMMVATALSSVVLTLVMVLYIFANRSFAMLLNYSDFNQKSLFAMEKLINDVRGAYAVLSLSGTELVLDEGTGNPSVTYTYDAGAKTLTRTSGGLSKVVLLDCYSMSFSIYQRTPVAGTFDQYPTATVDTCKVVQVSWSCSRKTIGSPVNTLDQRTTKIVLRN